MCGNFGLIGRRLPTDSQALLPARVVKILKKMGHETEVRGEQAGGGLVVARNPDNQTLFVGKKILNQKRGNLTRSLESAFAPVRRKARFQGIQPLESAIAAVWHYRYGTSSPPSILETHWHEWMPPRDAIVWQMENGQWVRSRKNINHRVTHNGDFNAWRIFDQSIETATLGLWLERVLHTPNATLGDSPKIAGMMDLLITQGMWDASLRLAYQLEIADSIAAAFGGQDPAKSAPNTAPSQQALSHWAEICEAVWQKHNIVRRLSDKDTANWIETQVLEISEQLSLSLWSPAKLTAFIRAAIHAFLHNDVYRATQLFLSRAEGSFGLVTVSTLSEANLVLSAQGQPMTIGFNVPEAYIIYASEPAAVNAVLVGMPESYRLDLDQKAGEVALVSINNITIYSLTVACELSESELAQRLLPTQHNPHLHRPKAETKDPVASDIQEIPQVLNAISTTWKNPASLNCRSAQHLAKLLIEKAKHFDENREKMIKAELLSDLAQSQTVDLLIVGIESSLWLGERFAQDLKTLLPLLNVKTLSANHVLRQLQHDPQALHLGKTSIVLAISQSGQTFPTLQATHAFDQLYRKNVIAGLFILTGELNSLMGVVIAQSYAQGATFSGRIFTNGSRQRSAEPATLTVAAAQATLTELLFYIATRLRQSFPNSSPLGMTLSAKSIFMLETIKADFLDRSVVAITGTTTSGVRSNSPDHRRLTRQGGKWGQHVTETPLAWGIHALYILIVLGWAIPFGHPIAVTQLLFRSIFLIAGLPGNLVLLLHPVFTLADIGIAIFGAWLWTLGLRFVQGRSLFARTGKRTLVIGDVPWVHQLLEAYVSKLFALSYGIASVEVHGANSQDHMLHTFGHRVVRGTLVLLGIPDGRRSQIQKNDQDAAIMTGKQTDGVRSSGAGPEVIALGHNPAIAHKGFHDTIVLESQTNTLLEARVPLDQRILIEEFREARFSSFERLLASYVLFWAFAKQVTLFPLLKYQHWKSQSRTRIATTAAPVSGISLDLSPIEFALTQAALNGSSQRQSLLLAALSNEETAEAAINLLEKELNSSE